MEQSRKRRVKTNDDHRKNKNTEEVNMEPLEKIPLYKNDSQPNNKNTGGMPKVVLKAKKKPKIKNDKERKEYEREKKRRQREKIKQDPAALAKAKEYEKNRSIKRRKEGKKKIISDMNPREQRIQRKKWREIKKRQKERCQADENLYRALEENSPPPTPETHIALQAPPRQAVSGRRRLRRDRAKVFRELVRTKLQLRRQEALVERWKKRYNRRDQTINSTKSPTPRKTTKTIMKKGAKEVQRKLLFGEVLKKQLETNAKEIKSANEKQLFYKSVSGNLLKKYKFLTTETKRNLNAKTERKYRCQNTIDRKLKISVVRQKRGHSTTVAKKKMVIKFLEEDRNSKVAPGKKDVITKSKVKVQKRFLTDSLICLYKRFCEENGKKLSYASFCRFKPFYIVEPKLTNRDTCLCITHENMRLITDKACRLKLIKTHNKDTLLKEICCNPQNYDCAKRECARCKSRTVLFSPSDTDDSEITYYYQWVQRKIEITDKKKVKREVNVTVKEKVRASVHDLKNEFNRQLNKFLIHEFKMLHQFKNLKTLKTSLQENEAVVVLDFSENYETKYSSEVQSVHFGASKKQVTLQTGVCFFKKDNEDHFKQFSSLSNDASHKAPAVWAHLLPVLEWLMALSPTIDIIHIQSDGPTSQYKNRTNCWLLHHFANYLNLKSLTWNFTEPGHGKSAADAVGGQLKRFIDKKVLFGKDILNAENMFDELVSSNISITPFLIGENSTITNMIPKSIKPVPKLMQVRQIVWNRDEPEKIWIRKLTCIQCSHDCKHYPLLPSNHTFSQVANNFETLVHHVNHDGTSEEVQVNEQESEIEEGSWVAAIYDDQWYPGVVERRDENFLSVSFMQKSGPRGFFWPSKPDIQTIEVDHIMCQIEVPPAPVSNRHYEFEKLFFDKIQSLFLSNQ